MTDEERERLRQLVKRAVADINRDYPKDLLQWRGKAKAKSTKKRARKNESNLL